MVHRIVFYRAHCFAVDVGLVRDVLLQRQLLTLFLINRTYPWFPDALLAFSSIDGTFGCRRELGLSFPVLQLVFQLAEFADHSQLGDLRSTVLVTDPVVFKQISSITIAALHQVDIPARSLDGRASHLVIPKHWHYPLLHGVHAAIANDDTQSLTLHVTMRYVMQQSRRCHSITGISRHYALCHTAIAMSSTRLWSDRR
jgi:hypothetical protein